MLSCIDAGKLAETRHGFPGITNKDAALFPEQFNEKFAMLHRVDPHMWVTFSPHLSCPWPRKMHKILAGATCGMMWDASKIGGGSQPIKTRFGWLLITHGVDYAHIYRWGYAIGPGKSRQNCSIVP